MLKLNIMLDAISKRIVDIQSNLHQVKLEKRALEQTAIDRVRERAQQIIDLLDVIELLEHGGDAKIIIKKVHKRLSAQMESLLLQEISFSPGDALIPGQTRVVETVTTASLPSGSVVQLRRKGYRIGESIIRPADVIVASKPQLM